MLNNKVIIAGVGRYVGFTEFIYLLYNRTRSTEHTHTKKKNIKSNHKITLHIVKQLVSTQKSY